MIIDENNPPLNVPHFGEKWERGLVRKGCWFLVDWCGNAVLWVEDGREF